ncbi:MAG: BspA family leucine-rich repeat surface protein [Butyrivibrio sp.]|nr:BspA family leucine-rich repeat surface protein [Butyrivibrio sp.]
MKKSLGNVFLFITVLLCLFFLPGPGRIKSQAATGDLYTGSEFNQTIKKFTNTEVGFSTDDHTIKRIIFAKKPPKPEKDLAKKKVGDGVYAYYDSTDNTVYVCCATKMKFNKNCSFMFIAFTKVESIDFGTNLINTAPMENAEYMFRCCDSLLTLDLTQFKTPNLNDMCQMFHHCLKLKSINLSTFNTSNVTDMQTVFANCFALETLDVSNFNTSKATMTFQMFEGLTSLKTLDLKNFDTRNVTNMYRMFDNCRNLETLNVSSFKTPNVKNVQEMFYGCSKLKYLDLSGFDLSKVVDEDSGGMLGRCNFLITVDAPCKVPKNFSYDKDTEYVRNCSIGEAFLDDNKDGIADSDEKYNYFIKANKSHRYIFPDSIERVEEAQYHSVTFYYSLYGGRGKATASPSKAKAGTVVTLTATPSEGYKFVSWQVKSGGVTIKDNKFTMGDSDVKILVNFEYVPIHNVTVSYGTGDGKYRVGESVTITANEPGPGKQFKEWQGAKDLTFTSGNMTTSTATFLMPNANVSLTAIYENVYGNPEEEYSDDEFTEYGQAENGAQGNGTPQQGNGGAVNNTSNDDQAKTSEKIDKKLKTTALSKPKAGKKSITLTWDKKAGSGIKGYEIQYSTDKKFKAGKTKTITINKAKTGKTTIKKLKSHTKYYIRIRTFTKKKGVKVYSKWSKVMNVKVK